MCYAASMRIASGLLLASLVLVSCSSPDSATTKQDGGPGSPDVAVAAKDVLVGDPDASPSNPENTKLDVLTQHNDNARTGANTYDTCLRPSTLSGLSQLATFHMDGEIYAQPLVYTAGGHRLLIVASTANELSAFDFDTLSTTPVWSLGAETFGTPGQMPRWNMRPLGILSTPVIDPSSGRLYVIARSCPTATSLTGCPQTVHSIDAATGKHLDSAVINGSVSTGSSASDVLAFNPDVEWNRAGLLLQDDKLVAAWACGQVYQFESEIVYNGWVMSFDVNNLHAAPVVYATAPHSRGGGIWQGGGGLVGDGTSIYFSSGNSEIDTTAASPLDYPKAPIDQEDSMVRLKISGTTTSVASYYDNRPYHSDGNVFQYMNYNDYDLSASGVTLIPGTDDLVGGSKGGIVYLVDRTTMKERQAPLSPFTATPLPDGETLHIASTSDGPEILGTPVVWSRKASDDALVYVWPRSDRLTAFHYAPASSTLTVGANSSDVIGPSGAMLSFSIDGADASSAVVWAILASGTGYSGPASLRAYDPISLQMLWQADVPGYARYVAPTVSGGRVFAASLSPTSGSDILAFGTSACGG
jgi:hypothetical protein